MFGRDLRNAISNGIGFGVDSAKATACVLIEQDGCLEPGKLAAGGARGATLHEP